VHSSPALDIYRAVVSSDILNADGDSQSKRYALSVFCPSSVARKLRDGVQV
jgi:hypothetical protein